LLQAGGAFRLADRGISLAQHGSDGPLRRAEEGDPHDDDSGGSTTPRSRRSTLKGNVVKNLAGEKLGKIEDFQIDLENGKIAYCVLSFGGVLGFGDKLFAVPFGAMTLDTQDHTFTLDIAKERLANAPGFDKDAWPDMTDRDWGERIYGFYNVQPYWM
jgi:sporulation protein YlmC with PRC-barrel domain